MSDVETRSFVEAARRENRAALEAAGVPAFAYAFERSHVAADALAAYERGGQAEGPDVAIAGRLVAWRPKGKVAFGHLEDASGRLQIYLRQDQLGPAWTLAEHLDLDDHLGVRGTLMRTRAGEVTVRAAELTLLAKSLRPLPRGKTQVAEDGSVRTFGGLHDPEVRFRQRYADLAVHPEAELDQVAAELNDRPRKRLGFRKPVEEIAELLLAA